MDIQKEIDISGYQTIVFCKGTEMGNLYKAMVKHDNLKVGPLTAFYLLQSGPGAWDSSGEGQEKGGSATKRRPVRNRTAFT